MSATHNATSAFAQAMAFDLEPEVDEGIEIAPRKERQNQKSRSGQRGSKCVRSFCERILFVAGFHQQIDDKQGDGEKAQHQERGAVLAPPGEIRKSAKVLRRRRERWSAKVSQAQAKYVECKNALPPEREELSKALCRDSIGNTFRDRKNQSFQRKYDAVNRSENDEGPVCAVPQPSQDHGYDQVHGSSPLPPLAAS